MYGVWKEVVKFDKVIGVALGFASKHLDTFIVITANHETGGLAILSSDRKLDLSIIKGYAKTADWFVKNFDVEETHKFKMLENTTI